LSEQQANGTLTARVAELEAIVAYLDDRQQIGDVYRRYMRGFDRNDLELLRSAFWPDVQINYGDQVNSFDDFVVKHLNRHTAELLSWGHLITNESVEIEGDVAHLETYVTALFNPKDETSVFGGGPTIVGGRYIDRLDRRNGEWRIAVREFAPHFSATVAEHARDLKWPDHAAGTWDRRDPSYRRPLKRRPRKDGDPAVAE